MNGKIATTTGDNDIRKISKAIEIAFLIQLKCLVPSFSLIVCHGDVASFVVDLLGYWNKPPAMISLFDRVIQLSSSGDLFLLVLLFLLLLRHSLLLLLPHPRGHRRLLTGLLRTVFGQYSQIKKKRKCEVAHPPGIKYF